MASAANAGTAPILWAQRKDSLYVTINLPDVTEPKLELTETKLTFTYVQHHWMDAQRCCVPCARRRRGASTCSRKTHECALRVHDPSVCVCSGGCIARVPRAMRVHMRMPHMHSCSCMIRCHRCEGRSSSVEAPVEPDGTAPACTGIMRIRTRSRAFELLVHLAFVCV
jgi:hypothetical protein